MKRYLPSLGYASFLLLLMLSVAAASPAVQAGSQPQAEEPESEMEAPQVEPAETPVEDKVIEETDAAKESSEVTDAVESAAEEAPAEEMAEASEKASKPKRDPSSVYVIPIEGPIATPVLYILRRGLKQAIDEGIDAVVLDMNTPGGRMDVMLEMMEMLDRFEGETITYVNVDAISAGSFIASATDEIYFAPKSQIGAAAVVQGTGEDVPDTMKQKINSYLLAKVRNYTSKYPYRGQVIRAMMDVDYVLTIDGEVIKPKGELLTLTADEAMQEFGNPPQPLLGAGIVDDMDELLDTKFGADNYSLESFEITWSETLAQYMDAIAPVLLGIGFLLLMIEFKTPGFGVPGITGICLLVIVFVSNYVAGLAGHEPIIFFMFGIILLGVELFVLPGTMVPAILGLILILGSLVWSMADYWPGGGESGGFDTDALWGAVFKLTMGLIIAVGGAVAVWRFLPKSFLWDKMILSGGVAPADRVTSGGGSSLNTGSDLPAVGTHGVAATDLHPAGEVEIEGKRYQATLGVGSLERGDPIIVTGYKNFALLVGRTES